MAQGKAGSTIVKCPICKIRLADSPHHIIPKAEGGSDGHRNKIPVCRICHDELEALADRGIPCTPAIIKLMQLGECRFEPKINTIEDINSTFNTSLAIEPIKWIPIDELLAGLPKKADRKEKKGRLAQVSNEVSILHSQGMSLQVIAGKLNGQGVKVSHMTVSRTLNKMRQKALL